MTQEKIKTPPIDFYITNVCNFNCVDCLSFNNYYFSGQQLWDDYADIYKKWGELIDIPIIKIVGGEPLMNPTVGSWINGLVEIWPSAKVGLVTNGTHINRVNLGLYDILAKHNGNVTIELSLHNIKRKQSVIKECKQFLDDRLVVELYDKSLHDDNLSMWREIYSQVRDVSWPDCDSPEDFDKLPFNIKKECEQEFNFSGDIFMDNYYETFLADINGVEILISGARVFDNQAVIRNNNIFSLHDSDPDKAYNKCFMKDCHYMREGKLYQCPIVGHLPEFYKQHFFDISDSDKDIMLNGYRPLSSSDSINTTKEFIETIGKQVTACKFCPETPIETRLEAGTNKIRLQKKPHD
jgi:organic radical activating enzyme